MGTWIMGAAFFALVAILVMAAWEHNEARIREEDIVLPDEPIEELTEQMPKHPVCGAILGDSAPCQQPLGHFGKHDYSLRDK